MVLSPDSSVLASVSADFTIILWDATTGTMRTTIDGILGFATSLAFSSDSKLLAFAARNNSVRLWSLDSGEEILVLDTSNPHFYVAISPDGLTLASASFDEMVTLWSLESRASILSSSQGLPDILNLAFSPDGQLLFLGTSHGVISVRDVTTGREEGSLLGHTAPISAIAVSSDSRLLASASDDGTTRLWCLETADAVAVFEMHHGDRWRAAHAVATHPC